MCNLVCVCVCVCIKRVGGLAGRPGERRVSSGHDFWVEGVFVGIVWGLGSTP